MTGENLDARQRWLRAQVRGELDTLRDRIRRDVDAHGAVQRRLMAVCVFTEAILSKPFWQLRDENALRQLLIALREE